MGRAQSTGIAVVLAFGTLVVGAASAAHPKLDLTWNGGAETLGIGEIVRLKNEGTFTFATNPGVVTCGEADGEGAINVKDQTNDEPTDKLELHSTFGQFAGLPPCASTSPLGSAARVFFQGNGGTLNLKGYKESAEMKAKSATEPITLLMVFGERKCQYAAKKLKGSLHLEGFGPPWKRLSLGFVEQKFKLTEASPSTPCSKKVKMTAQFGKNTVFRDPEEFLLFGQLVP